MVDYVYLYNRSMKFYKRGITKDKLQDSYVSWIKYFLDINCNDFCKRILSLYFDSTYKLSKREVAKMLDVSLGTVDARLRDIYKVVNFCDRYISDTDFHSLEDRIKLKMYDKVFIVELLLCVDIKYRNTYVNTLLRNGISTLEDLLSKDACKLCYYRGVGNMLLMILSDSLVKLGIDDFKIKREDTDSVISMSSDYCNSIRKASSKEDAVEVLLQFVESRGYNSIANTFRETWVFE